jgi:hypothetical protein
MMKHRALLSLLPLGLTLATACEEQPAQPPVALVTMATLNKLAGVPTFGAGLDPVFTQGFEPSYFLKEGKISVATAFTERWRSAYMTTDIWVNFPVVWVQPVYIVRTQNKGARWIFSVAEDSRFYSPFWRAYEVMVPDDTLERYTSVRDVLNAKLPFKPGPGRLATLVPNGIAPAPVNNDEFVATLLERVPAPPPPPDGPAPDKLAGISYKKQMNGWFDGRPREYVDFGADRFEWNERDEVVEQPLFFFFKQNAGTKAWEAVTDLPRVGGTGPLYTRRPAIAPNSRPIFGSFWRLWAARLPSAAYVFVPPGKTDVWGRHTFHNEPHPALTVVTPRPSAAMDPLMQAAVDRHAFQVVLAGKTDAACLEAAMDDTQRAACSCAATATTAAELDACPWLNSQAAVEQNITRDNLVPSQILVACPYIAFDDKPVPYAVPQ